MEGRIQGGSVYLWFAPHLLIKAILPYTTMIASQTSRGSALTGKYLNVFETIHPANCQDLSAGTKAQNDRQASIVPAQFADGPAWTALSRTSRLFPTANLVQNRVIMR